MFLVLGLHIKLYCFVGRCAGLLMVVDVCVV